MLGDIRKLIGWPKSAPWVYLFAAALLWVGCRWLGAEVEAIRDPVNGFGSAVLAGAVAGGFMKALQVSTLIRDELREVLSEDIRDDAWLDATRKRMAACCERDVDTTVHCIMRCVGVGSNNEAVRTAYYQDCTYNLEIEWLDEVDGRFQLKEHATHTIRSRINEAPIQVPYEWRGGPSEALEMTHLTVTPVGVLNAKPKDWLPLVKSENNKRAISYALELSGAQEYRLEKHSTRTGSIHDDPFNMFTFERHANRAMIRITTHSKTIGLGLIPMGFSFLNEGSIKGSTRTQSHDGTLLPGQGFLVVAHRTVPKLSLPPTVESPRPSSVADELKLSDPTTA